MKVRTALSRPFLAGQTDDRRFFSKSRQNPDCEQNRDKQIWTKIEEKSGQTESGQQTDPRHDSPENLDKMKRGQVTNSAVRRRPIRPQSQPFVQIFNTTNS